MTRKRKSKRSRANGMTRMQPFESALVVLVPEAEVLVKLFRDKHDPAAAMGMPAHVTLLYPFIPPIEIGSAVHDDLRQCFSHFAPFHFSIADVRRFPGVVYLTLDPDDPFRDLTLAIWHRYPEQPPYGGRHSDIVPHLCVARIADEQHLDAVAEEFMRASTGKLPIQASADKVALIDNSSGRWRIRSTLPLAFDG